VSIWSTDTGNTLAIDYVTIAIEYSVPDDSSDSNWSGPQRNGVGPAIAVAAAGLALATAIGFGIQQQNEEILPIPASPFLSASESLHVIPVGDEPIGFAFTDNDTIAPQLVLEGDEWAPSFTTPQMVVAQPWSIKEEFPTRIDEEYWWQAPSQVAVSVQPLVWIDEEIIPQPVSFVPSDDDWQPLVALETKLNIQVWSLEDDITQNTFIGENESLTVLSVGELDVVQLFSLDDNLPVVAAVTTPTEDDWQPLVTYQPVIQTTLWFEDETQFVVVVDDNYTWELPVVLSQIVSSVFSTDDDIVPQPAPFIPSEDYWLQLAVDKAEVVVLNFPEIGGGGVPTTQPTSISIVEADWQVWTPALVKPLPLYLPDPEQTPALYAPAGAESGASSFGGRRIYTTEFRLWEFIDELPQQPVTPLPFDEELWQVYTPPLQAAKPLYLPEPEELPAGSLRGVADDEYWQVYTPVALAPIVTLWAENDETVPQPLPLNIDESDWQVYTPVWLAAQPLYLPDPESIPAGSLVTPPSAPLYLYIDLLTGNVLLLRQLN
jgi:hypothetical protein